ncbi:substrate-binding domain-containing protein [Pseudomonas sp. CFBP 13727]|uniref:substrate-binding domain-containing protein n=1 Tax=Pseudomonas sp. CFBP 13727 TaxID=2775295 RepID=UPI001785F960|nr:substrate-binding domain-containing protein [Pseudomonas sp. CFBP 13727]MBD8621495.1 substrate-binding domain-containing protein [Pseudomonas sp. CFBP 13727]
MRRLLLILCILSLGMSLSTGALADSATLRIHGSNTMGTELVPALIRGLLESRGLAPVQTLDPSTGELLVTAHEPNGTALRFEVGAHGSSTGFDSLLAGQADLAASSRPISDQERSRLAPLGDLSSFGAEHVIGIDGVAVIVHPDNPLRQLTTRQLAQVFSGEINDWNVLGGRGPIHVLARDDRSGTWETFRDQVLTPHAGRLTAHAVRLESSEQLSDRVSADRYAIGFIGLASIRGARALAIADGDSQFMAPTVSLIATQDYPLSRRLYLYSPPMRPSPWADALIAFAQSEPGQAIVAQQGFVAQTVQAMSVPASPDMPMRYRQLAREGRRLSVSFRFAEGSATLDNKAMADVVRVQDYLRSHHLLQNKTTLVGFGDAKDDSARAVLLSRLRAMAVRRELARADVLFRDIQGFGAQLPVATNAVDEGRIKNRRVEVWVNP